MPISGYTQEILKREATNICIALTRAKQIHKVLRRVSDR